MSARLILPVGVTLALLAALCDPRPGLWLIHQQATFGIVAIMFLLNGYQTDLRTCRLDLRFAQAFLLAAIVSLIGGVVVARLTVALVPIDPMLAVGLIVMCAMPPTLSSVVVITQESGGDTLWALVMTIGISLLSIVSLPVLLPRFLAHDLVAFPTGTLFQELLLSVLLPLIIGLVLRHWLRKAPAPFVNRIPTLLIIVLSYLSFSAGREKILGSSVTVLGLTILMSLAIHLALLACSFVIARLCRYAAAEQKAFTFIGAQKTLPTAITILTVLGAVSAGAAIPCIILYFTQQICDAIVAYRWHESTGPAFVERVTT